MSGSETRFDIAVVGLGLIGAAALRHLAESIGSSVVGVGPAEPVDWATHRGPFASHYDSGRITRRLDARREWAILASRAIDQYPIIEDRSGRRFHHPVGLSFVRNDRVGIENQLAVIDQLGLPVSVGSTDEPHELLREYRFPGGWTTLTEPGPAGFIDPREMAAAQVAVAESDGAVVYRTHVVDRVVDSAGGHEIRCADGTTLHAARVLVATGPYGNDLLPEALAILVAPEAVILGRVSDHEAERLRDLPSVIYLLDHPVHDDVYVVPPTRYPDGRSYIKMGGSHARAGDFVTSEHKRSWMAGNEADAQLPVMEEILRELLPAVDFESFSMKPCLITDTLHGLPFVDQVDDGLFVAFGGNGHAAKSADAIGALGAGLALSGSWPDAELRADAFTAVTGPYRRSPGSRHGN